MKPQLAKKSKEVQSDILDFSFVGKPLLKGRHRIHAYPAMIHPLLVERLIQLYGRNSKSMLDPFCGSGTTLLTSSYAGIDSVGFDINPLALTIAQAKTSSYDFPMLRKNWKQLNKHIKQQTTGDTPSIKNIDYWYLPTTIEQLSLIRSALMSVNLTYTHFFTTLFAFVCRKYSLTKISEFKRVRRANAQELPTQGDVREQFIQLCDEMIDLYESLPQPSASSEAQLQNVTHLNKTNPTYDLVITSPPYGDSRTTVAYGQYSSFGLSWIEGLPNVDQTNYQVDLESLGGRRTKEKPQAQFKELSDVIDRIQIDSPSRANDVEAFFADYYRAIKQIVSLMKSESTACFVVGNRTVKGQTIPLDQITRSMFLERGLTIEGIYPRKITGKVMPLRNSPQNKTGKTGQTMTREFVVVAKK